MFFECKKLAEVNIPESIRVIGVCAFSYCESISHIIIPHGVEKIADYAFSFCKLSYAVLPTSIVSLGYGCLMNGYDSSTVYYMGTKDEWNAIEKNQIVWVCFYSPTKPQESGIYWYYDADGNVVTW